MNDAVDFYVQDVGSFNLHGRVGVLLLFMGLIPEVSPVPEQVPEGVMKVVHSSSGLQGWTPEDVDAHQRYPSGGVGDVWGSLTLKCH